MLSFFPLDVLDEIWDVLKSVSEGFPTYSCVNAGESLTNRINFKFMSLSFIQFLSDSRRLHDDKIQKKK